MKKVQTLFLLVLLMLIFTSCVFTYNLKLEDIDKVEKAEIIKYKVDDLPEKIEYTVAETEAHIMQETEEAPQNAIFIVSPVGGNPVYYAFENSLTIRGFDKNTEAYCECTLNLPEGFVDGKIVYASSGAGSGEVEMIASANKDGEEKFLSYFFFAGNEKGYLCPVFVNILSRKPDYVKLNQESFDS